MANVVKQIVVSNGLVQSGTAGTVDTADITADAVTFAKLQNIATSRLLGRTTASSGNVEELTVGAALTLTAGSLNAKVGPAGTTYTESNVVVTRTFDADTVTLAALADVVGTLIQDLRTAGLVS